MLNNTDQNNYKVFRGDDFAVQLVFTDTDNGAIDIANWTISLTFKEDKDDTDEQSILHKDFSDFPNPKLGIALVTVSHTDTINLSGTYFYDFQLKKADDTIQTITSGSVTFERDITRRIT